MNCADSGLALGGLVPPYPAEASNKLDAPCSYCMLLTSGPASLKLSLLTADDFDCRFTVLQLLLLITK